MSKVRKLNALLRQELGEPLRAWKLTNDLCFQHPMPAYDSSGDPVYDLVCLCGVNVRVHGPSCKMTLSRRKAVRRNIIFDYENERQSRELQNRWLLAVSSPLLLSEWRRKYPSIDFPSGGLWYPVSDQGGYMMLDHGLKPDRAATEYLIKVIRQFRRTGYNDLDRAYEAYLEKVEDGKRRRYGDHADDLISVSENPGGKSDVSLPSPMWQIKGRRGILIGNGRHSTSSSA